MSRNLPTPTLGRPCLRKTLNDKIRNRKLSINNREFLIAAGDGDLNGVKSCMAEGVEVNFRDIDGNTALHYAVEHGECLETVTHLLQQGADVGIENNNNETPLEIAAKCENHHISVALGQTVVTSAFGILGKCEHAKGSTRSVCSNSMEMRPEFDCEMTETFKKMNRLSHLLGELQMNGDENLSFQQANIFILLVETFAFHNIHDKTVRKKLEEKFFDTAAFVDTRVLMLKKTGGVELGDIQTIIKNCCSKVLGNESNIAGLFGKLLQIINDKIQDPMMNLQPILTTFPHNAQRGCIGKCNPERDPYDRLKHLVLAAYRKDENLDQSWFEFVVNIYPALELEKKQTKDMNAMERQLKHLRNNLIHEFYKFDIEEFRAAIIDIRGKLFEYYYAIKTNQTLTKITVTTNIEDLKRELNENLDHLCKEFMSKSEQILSEEEAKKMYGYKLVKPLFKRQSTSAHVDTVRAQVVNYLKYLGIVEDGSVECDDSEDDATTDNVDLFDNLKRREMFEGFVRLKKIRDNFAIQVYVDEKRIFFNRLVGYGVSRTKLNAVSECFIEKYTVFNEAVTDQIENIVRFILTLEEIVTVENEYKQTDINILCDLLLSQNNTSKKLIFRDDWDDLKNKTTYINRIRRVIQQLEALGEICLQLNDIVLQIDVKRMTKNMLAVFYNAFHEYTIEFNTDEIFSRESFLNELVWEISKQKSTEYQKFTIIYKIINIDYMSPLIVKIIQSANSEAEVIDKDCISKLVDVLLSKKYIFYLNILLNSKGEKFSLYHKLYEKLFKKEVDIQDVRELFTETDHLSKLSSLLIFSNMNNKQLTDHTLILANNLLQIINEEAAKRVHQNFATEEKRLEALDVALKILQEGEKLKSWVVIAEEFKQCYSQIVYNNISIARIKNRQLKSQEALSILESEEVYNLCTPQQKLLIQGDIAYTKCKMLKEKTNHYDTLYNNVLRYVLALDDTNYTLNAAFNDSETFDIALTLKEKHEQIKNTEIYKNLLTLSKLLHSSKYLDILKIATDSAFQLTLSGQHQKAVKIYKDIYTCYKNDLGTANKFTIRLMLFIAKEYSDIGDQYKQDKRYSESLIYYYASLLRFNSVHDAREKMYGYDYGAVSHIRIRIVKVLENIAFTYNKFDVDEQTKALNIYEKIVNFQEKIGSNQDRSAFTKINLMHTINIQGRQDESRKDYKVALEKCNEVIKIFQTIGETCIHYEKALKQLRFAEMRKARILTT